MPFDLENLNPSAWFTVPDEKTGEPTHEKLCLRLPSVDLMDRINKETTKKTVEYRHPLKENGRPDLRKPLQRIEFEEVIDPNKRTNMLWDHIIVDWEIYTPQGERIPCTTENKVLMMKGSSRFASLVNEYMDEMQKAEEEHKKDLEKNSSTSPSE